MLHVILPLPYFSSKEATKWWCHPVPALMKPPPPLSYVSFRRMKEQFLHSLINSPFYSYIMSREDNEPIWLLQLVKPSFCHTSLPEWQPNNVATLFPRLWTQPHPLPCHMLHSEGWPNNTDLVPLGHFTKWNMSESETCQVNIVMSVMFPSLTNPPRCGIAEKYLHIICIKLNNKRVQ